MLLKEQIEQENNSIIKPFKGHFILLWNFLIEEENYKYTYIRRSKVSKRLSFMSNYIYEYLSIFLLMNNHYKTRKSCIFKSPLVGIICILNIIIIFYVNGKKKLKIIK